MPEITYHIDKAESDQSGILAVKLAEAERTGFSLEILSSKLPVNSSRWLQLSTPKDKDPQRLLSLKEIKLDNGVLKIPYSQSIQALKWLAASGKFFFNKKQLVCDFFTPVEFYYLVEHPSVKGMLKFLDQEFDLSTCDFICGGSQPWFIKGILLKLVQTDVSWKDFKQLHKDPSKFSIEDLDTEEDSPRIVYKGNSLEEFKQTQQPLPLLVLKDRSGAFADLWIDYGNGKLYAFHDHTAGKRDLQAEKNWEKDLLETSFTSKIVGNSHYYCPLDQVAKSLSFLLEIGWNIQDYQGKKVVKLTDSNIDISLEKNQILLRGTMRYDTFEANIKDVAGAFNKRERFVQIGSEAVGLLPEKWDGEGFSSLFEEGEIVSDGISLKKYRVGALEQLFQNKRQPALDESLQKLKTGMLALSEIPQIQPDATFLGTLRPYQQEGINWLNFLHQFGFNGILSDDMGLGKTVQVLAFLSQFNLDSEVQGAKAMQDFESESLLMGAEHSQKVKAAPIKSDYGSKDYVDLVPSTAEFRLRETKPVLIVMPTSLIFNWKREIERFLPHKKVILYHGPSRSLSSEENVIVLTSYTTMRMDILSLSRIEFSAIILDEAQAIKNSLTQVAQAAYQLQSNFRLLLTGTPIENHMGELWSHFHFLMPELLGEEKSFLADLQAGESDSRYLQKIKKKIRPFILRRKKSEVAKDLPDCIEQTVWVEMYPEQRQIYEDYLAGVKNQLFTKVNQDGLSKHRMEVFEAILRLRQICCHPLLISGQLPEDVVVNSGKMDALMEDIETALEENDKVLVYSQFTSMLQLIAKEVQKKQWKHVYLDGSTKDREKVVNQFQEDPETHLFLISLKAGGTGLNLTAADHVMIFDPWWNEAAEMQAINRAHRIGRKSTVFAKRYATTESIEEKMMRLKERKKLIIDALLEDEQAFTQLTLEDFTYLFS